jgi:beta-lactamase regulating signal transducer with metallopeptidase domain
MDEFLLHAAGWWLGTAIGGGLILLAACGVMRLLKQPAARQRVGEWAVLAALLVAVLRLGPTWLPLPWESVAHAEALPADVYDWVAEPRPAAAIPLVPMQECPSPPAPAAAEAFILRMRETPPQPPAGPPPHAATAWDWRPLAAALTGIYLITAGVLLARWVLGQWALARLLRQAKPAPFRLRRLFTAMAAATLWPLPGLFQTRRVRMPICFGLRRPAVVLPEALANTADDTALRWVFAHELTHLRRRDLWTYWAFGLAQAVFFFVPWFWWIRRQVRLCQEYVADAAAAAQGVAPDEYAAFLVSLAKSPAAPLGAAGLGNSSDLFRRVNMLLQNPMRVQMACPRRWSLVAAGALFGAAVLFSGLGLRAEDADDAKKEQKNDAILRLDGAPQQDKVILRLDGQGQGEKILVLDDGSVRFEKLDPMVHVVLGLEDDKDGDKADGQKRLRYRVVRTADGDDAKKPIVVRVERDERDGDKKDGDKKVEQKTIVIRVPANADPDTIKKAVEKAMSEAKAQAKKAEGDNARGDEARKRAAEALRKLADKDQTDIGDKVRKALEEAQKALEKDHGARAEELKKAMEAFQKAAQDEGGAKEDVQKRVEAARKAATAARAQAEEMRKQARAQGEEARKRADEIRKQVDKKVEEAQKEKEGAGQAERRARIAPLMAAGGQGRLGVHIEAPSKTLADQLDLPKDQGLVIADVRKDSPAEKAGLKSNDIILEFDGKPVSNEPGSLAKLISGVKADTSVNAVVLRKGKKVTVRGIKLGEAKPAREFGIEGLDGKGFKEFKLEDLPQLKGAQWKIDPKEFVPQFKEGQFKIEIDPKNWAPKVEGPRVRVERPRGEGTERKQNQSVSVTVNDGNLSAVIQQDGVRIAVKGTAKDGKVDVSDVTINEDGKTNRYKDLNKVPEKYRSVIQKLIDNSPGGAVRFEFKTDKKKDDGKEEKREKIKEKDEDNEQIKKQRNESHRVHSNVTSVTAPTAVQSIQKAITATVSAFAPTATTSVTGTVATPATPPAEKKDETNKK